LIDRRHEVQNRVTRRTFLELVGQGYNHFEIFETIANPYGLLRRAALEQMNLVPA